MPEEFSTVAHAYQSTAALLGDTVKRLKDYATRLVSDGDWGGESARAMLGRMALLQEYLHSLQAGLTHIPDALEMAGGELSVAKEKFDKATEQQYVTVDAGATVSAEFVNDPNADAREFMRQLNGRLAEAHRKFPERLPWDAELASAAPAPDMLTLREGEPTMPSHLSMHATHHPLLDDTIAGGSVAHAAPSSAATSLAGTLPVLLPEDAPGGAPSVGSSGGSHGAPTGIHSARPPGGLVNGPPGGLPSVAMDAPHTTPSPAPHEAAFHAPPPRTGTQRADRSWWATDDGGPSVIADAAAPSQGRRPPGMSEPETSPSFRPNIVPVVDGTSPALNSSPGGSARPVTMMSGAPFMPPITQFGKDDVVEQRLFSLRGDDARFFQSDDDTGTPVVA
ncbi:WXG100 family type VII secretion target [Nonomuraea recticatena]